MLKFESPAPNLNKQLKNVVANGKFKISPRQNSAQNSPPNRISSSTSAAESVERNHSKRANNNNKLRANTTATTKHLARPKHDARKPIRQTPTTKTAAAAVVGETASSPIGSQTAQNNVMVPSQTRKQTLGRVKSITGKLLDAHGAELRRSLFSLKQIFQEDAELAIAFLEAGGCECLLKVARGADQIHQNYILRAISQLAVAQPNGLALLLRHKETIQWLHELSESSQHQIVVKSSSELLASINQHKTASEQVQEAAGQQKADGTNSQGQTKESPSNANNISSFNNNNSNSNNSNASHNSTNPTTTSARQTLTMEIYQMNTSKQQQSSIASNALDSSDLRSESTTPTISCMQQVAASTTTTTSNMSSGAESETLTLSPSSDKHKLAFSPSDRSELPLAKDPSRIATQYTMPSITSPNLSSSQRGSEQQHSNTSTPQLASTKAQQQQQALPQHQSHQLQQPQQEPYYHNLFQWEQLVSKGVTRPLLINDLDFTDLRDEDDCDLLAANNTNNNAGLQHQNHAARSGGLIKSGEPLTISIPAAHHQSNLDHDSDSGASTGSPGSRRSFNEHQNGGTPASAPPPLPPPPISPWFNTISGSRPQSQFMSSPSPPPPPLPAAPFEGVPNGIAGTNRDPSPPNSTYSSYSRNSVCVPQGLKDFSSLQGVGSLRSASSMSSLLFGNNGKYGSGKRKKTMKLFWKEVREDRSLLAKLTKKKTIWDEIKPIQVDTQKLEYLFESKAKDLSLSKSRNGLDGLAMRKVKITVLDAKRSNAINIGMTKLPPMRTIKSAILKMDSSIMNREDIEKILTTMMPSEEEKSRIIEAQLANPDTPLGTAEQFLLNLASISALEARLKLWAFQLDYAQIEKEVAEPLMDLKQAIDEIERSETFRNILGTLLSIGNFLNSTNVKGFQIDYLEKVPEVKDTVHKHSLLHHLCLFIQEKFDPDLASDLYSEFSAVNRASKVDYTEVAKNLKKMQQDCKASWDHLKIVAKHDGLANLMNPSCSVINQSAANSSDSNSGQHLPKSGGKLNNLSRLSMITTVIGGGGNSQDSSGDQPANTKQMKMKVSDFLTDCAERIMVLMVIHRRVLNRFQKLLVYLGSPSHQIKQAQPQQILRIINEFALEYRTKRERVREMLMRKQQCQHHNNHHHHHHGNRWQLNRSRWAGSQQCIDSLSYNNRPSSTASSMTSSSYAAGANLNCPECALSRRSSLDPNHPANQQRPGGHLRAGSPSGLSQISNYSDYLLDQTSSCCSRQESMTPVASTMGVTRRPHSMSVSMYDLQQQQQQQHHEQDCESGGKPGDANDGSESAGANRGANCMSESEQTRQRDEQMRRLLGAGKSFDGACGDLYQLSHWSSTMARVARHPPISSKQQQQQQQRASSIDCADKQEEAVNNRNHSFDAAFCDHDVESSKRQSSYYRYLHSNGNSNNCSMDEEQNSDEEILQSLMRAATVKTVHNQNGSHSNRSSLAANFNDSNSSDGTSSSGRSAKSNLMSRFNCDRESLRRTLRPSLESNA